MQASATAAASVVSHLSRARWTFPGNPSSVSQARRNTQTFLGTHGVEGRVGDDVILIVSELLTNAVVHGSGPVELCITHLNGTVHGAVTDEGEDMPKHRAEHSAGDENGRGLAIVANLADRWGCTLPAAGTGKTVWFLLALRKAESP